MYGCFLRRPTPQKKALATADLVRDRDSSLGGWNGRTVLVLALPWMGYLGYKTPFNSKGKELRNCFKLIK